MQLIGREREVKELTRLKESSQAELVVLYGRRRVGKTYLVRSFFDDKFSFYCTGFAKGNRRQLSLDRRDGRKLLYDFGRNSLLPAFIGQIA